MIYLFKAKLNPKTSIFYALCSIYGISIKSSKTFCKKLGFCENLKVAYLSESQIKKLHKLIDSSNLLLNNDLISATHSNLKLAVKIKSYKGLRRLKGFPVRGQRTHTNANSAKKMFK